MSEKPSRKQKQNSPDWFVQGVLTKIGDTFDRLTGRGWKPSSSLATSELAERLKQLVDAEARETDWGRIFVPHNIKLKMQWDKFSADSEGSLKALETELLVALIDHINDKRYYTYAPIMLEVKPDYFTTGVKLSAGFEESDDDEAAIDVSMPGFDDSPTPGSIFGTKLISAVVFSFHLNGLKIEKELTFEGGNRLSVGRTKENDLAIDDPSVSKLHASLMMNPSGDLVVADIGSTNGTSIDGERIPYGKAVEFSSSQKLTLGEVNLNFEVVSKTIEAIEAIDALPDDNVRSGTFSIGEFEFTRKIEDPATPETHIGTAKDSDVGTVPNEIGSGPVSQTAEDTVAFTDSRETKTK